MPISGAAGLAVPWLAAIAAIAAPAAAVAGCDVKAPAAIAFDQATGVRTKWLSLTRDARNTIQPDLEGLPLKQWIKNLEAIGVNLAEINLEPARLLAARPVVPDAALLQAVGAFYTPAATLDPGQRQQADTFVNTIFPRRQYTLEQRNAVQLDFLRRLEALRRRGDIAGSVRFLIHQRLWFPQQAAAEDRETRAAQFSRDMASFIDLAEEHCLGHWLAGVRLGENANTDMNELLPLIVELTERINAATNDWLKTHLFLANGGGWGAEYRGIDRVVGPDGKPFAFFARMAAATGGFAFGYKWMQFHDQIAEGIRGHMELASCAGGRHCDPNSATDWETYLGATLGFNDLTAFIKANRARYPAAANVVFVGDSSDSVTQMVEVGADGRLADAPSLAAVRHLLQSSGAGFRGRVFMNGYDSVKVTTSRRQLESGGDDIGRMLYAVDAAARYRLLPQSEGLWRDWPGRAP